MFKLHPQLDKDCDLIIDLPLCSVLLMNDSQYPWLILVPRVDNIREIIELSPEQQQQLWQESANVSHALQDLVNPDKLNIAALGNMVPQLHIHHIARFKSDNAWPAPVWGVKAALPYDEAKKAELIESIKQRLK